jgi:hypothetical protein
MTALGVDSHEPNVVGHVIYQRYFKHAFGNLPLNDGARQISDAKVGQRELAVRVALSRIEITAHIDRINLARGTFKNPLRMADSVGVILGVDQTVVIGQILRPSGFAMRPTRIARSIASSTQSTRRLVYSTLRCTLGCSWANSASRAVKSPSPSELTPLKREASISLSIPTADFFYALAKQLNSSTRYSGFQSLYFCGLPRVGQ